MCTCGQPVVDSGQAEVIDDVLLDAMLDETMLDALLDVVASPFCLENAVFRVRPDEPRSAPVSFPCVAAGQQVTVYGATITQMNDSPSSHPPSIIFIVIYFDSVITLFSYVSLKIRSPEG